MQFEVEAITKDDAFTLLMMIHELASYEKMSTCVKATEDSLSDDIEKGAVHGFIAYTDNEDRTPVGMLLYYNAYSTWEGQYIHMEDLYVREKYRRRGIGKLLWRKLAQVAKERKCPRLQWNVLDWNETALKFYKTTEAIDLTKKEGWCLFRLTSDGIAKLAQSD